MIRYLLDSNIVSEPARPSPALQVQARLRAHAEEVCIASVVWHELVYGVERLAPGRKRDFLTHYLLEVVRPVMPVLPFDAAAAEWLGRERARLEAIGRPHPVMYGMIAAVAATRGLILVTRNTQDFAGFDGIHTENWFEEGR